MKILMPGHRHIEHDVDSIRFIEKIGRICYKSEDKITEDSAEKFVASLIKRGHWAMLEHETIYLEMNPARVTSLIREVHTYGGELSYLHMSTNIEPNIVSGSFRSFYDLFVSYLARTNDPDYKKSQSTIMHLARLLHMEYPIVYPEHLKSGIACMPEVDDMQAFIDNNRVISRDNFIRKYEDIHPDVVRHHLTHSVCFTCDRGVSHELVRHRPCSFAQESTRYCNYSQDKFGNEISVIKPVFYDEGSLKYRIWENLCKESETAYFELLRNGSKPQEARDVLPTSVKTEIVMTATEEEWQHIVNLRVKGVTGAPHPQMVEVMEPWYESLKTITNGRIL